MGPIIDKIRKLFALSEGAGTEQEAAAALAKAKELMLKYALTMAEVAMEKETVGTTERVIGQMRAPRWKRDLAHVISYHFFCSLLSRRGLYRSVIFVGVGKDCEVAGFVFDYASRTIEQLIAGRRDRSSFAKGCVAGFHGRLKEVFPKGVSSETVNALVLAKNAAVDAYCDRVATGTARERPDKTRLNASFLEGVRAGYNIPLRIPVETGEEGPAALGGAK